MLQGSAGGFGEESGSTCLPNRLTRKSNSEGFDNNLKHHLRFGTLVAICSLGPISGRSMLDYLDGLCAALLARNGTEIRRLLRHPLARALPRRVREEGYAIARAGPESLRAPVQTLHFYHQTLHLLGARSAAAHSDAPSAAERTGSDGRQIEMPLRAAGG
jgi:hypothetical protein